MKKKKPYLRYLLFLVICILFYIIFRNSFAEIWGQVCNTNLKIIFAISLSAILYHMMEGRITYLLARRHTSGYTYIKGVKNSFYASFYRVVTLGSAGGLSAIYNLHLDKVPISDALGLYFVGYVIHKIAILMYGLLVILLRTDWIRQNFSGYRTYFILAYGIGIVTVIGLVLLCVSPLIYRLLAFLITKLRVKFPSYDAKFLELTKKMEALQTETKSLLTNKRLLLQLLLDNFIKLSTYYIIPYLILGGTSSIDAIDSLSLVAVIYILAAAIPTPAGVGSIEAVYILLAIKFISNVEAASSMLLFRFATMIVPCAIGGLYIVGRSLHLARKEKRFSHE